FMRDEGYSSLRLVTASYHMRRSLLEFHRAMPEVTMIPHPVFPEGFRAGEWWRWPGTLNLLISEYSKFLAAVVRQALGIEAPSRPGGPRGQAVRPARSRGPRGPRPAAPPRHDSAPRHAVQHRLLAHHRRDVDHLHAASLAARRVGRPGDDARRRAVVARHAVA